ncbi:hypothetical protein ACHQM5_010662 [Ranunculus cassubicifolius]
METSIVQLFCAVLVVCSFGEGVYAQCKLSDIQITQIPTGKKVTIADEFLVTVKNNCRCTLRNVILDCTGFSTFENIDPAILIENSKQECTLLQKQPFLGHATVQFKYAYLFQKPLSPKRAESHC